MPAHYAPLAADCLLHFIGSQVPTFLQGQLTCDCLQLTATQSVPGALCTAQGRVVTDCRVLELNDNHIALRLRRDVRDVTRETLKKYAMFSRTEISEQDDAWTQLGVWGSDAAGALAGIVPSPPDGDGTCAWGDDLMVCQSDGSGTAFELTVKTAALPGVLSALAQRAQPADEAHWQQHELQRGLIRTTAALSGNHLPQALNYDLAGLLNFRKGCYIGQEVVARLHYRGRSKRRCGVYAVEPNAAPQPGATLLTACGERGVGSVLRVVAADGAPSLVIALVSVDDSEQPLTMQDCDNPRLQPVPLPYSIRGSTAAS